MKRILCTQQNISINLLRINVIQLLLLIYMVTCSFCQFSTGLADNGDFSRIMVWVTSGPTGFNSNWPLQGTQEYELRFFNYWIPYWNFDFLSQLPIFSSTIFLWLPGVAINYLLFSTDYLYLPLISLAPRFLTIFFLLLIFLWLNNRPNKNLLTILIGIPYVLIFTSTDYVAFFNSFYQETGSLIYSLFLFAVLGLSFITPYKLWPALSLALVAFLLITAKVSNLYWILFIAPILITFGIQQKKIPFYIFLSSVLTLSSFYVSYKFTASERMRDATAYASLFYGAIPFSSHTQYVLEKLNLENAADCINVEPYTIKGDECMLRLDKSLNHINTIRTIFYDPTIILRQIEFGANHMQVLSLDLGKYSKDDPVGQRSILLNIWSQIKSKLFPKGNLYLVSVGIMVGILVLSLRLSKGQEKIIPLIGLISASASFTDMYMAVFGDGRRDILKHLIFSNFLYDIALIAFACVLFLTLKNTILNKRNIADQSKRSPK